MADQTSTTSDLATGLLLDGFGRINDDVGDVVEGLTVQELLWRPDADANHIAWLVWHLTRQQDEQIAHLGGTSSVWRETDLPDRFDLPYKRSAHGYGMSSAEVGAFTLTDPELLVEYHRQVHDLTERVLRTLGPSDYERVIDRNWDPPVTVAIRLVSVVDDSAKHMGQAAYVRGLVVRRR